ncbi:MAG TPA: hypothetical protein VFP68_02505 [Burkholderiaceae bacterium]|nr:hypothetical protein [Burkholderiaceae bacterium]
MTPKHLRYIPPPSDASDPVSRSQSASMRMERDGGGDADLAGLPQKRGTGAAEKLGADCLQRFLGLIDEVTEQLMQDGGDHATCRADAITLLVEAAQQFDEQSDGQAEESPLAYLLLEEQQKAKATLCESRESSLWLDYFKA